MKLYLDNLIPRLKEFSLSLDKQEVFIDKQWVIVDENLNKQTYIFRRNGELIMALNGIVTIGKWEYISAANSLLIDRVQDKILLNQNFIDSAVMILKKDGFKDDNFILANENLIPDLDVLKYLKQLYYKNSDIDFKKLKNGTVLELKRNNANSTFSLNTFVTIDGVAVEDGRYEFEESNKKYLIEDGHIVRIFSSTVVNTQKGRIIIERQVNKKVSIGNLVYKNDDIAPDGKYRIDFFDYIWVTNGVITKHTYF